MMAKRSTKIRQRQDPAHVMAKTLLPASQARRGEFTIVDVANHSEGDQRHAVRSGETRTIRRKPKLHCLVDAKVITKAEAETCQWYIDTHCAAFDTVGVTANYGGSLGGGQVSYTHHAKNLEQATARIRYSYARAAISPILVPLFEKVVLHSRPMGKLVRSFRLAVSQLRDHLEEMGEAA